MENMLERLKEFDWQQAFGYAGEPDTCGTPSVVECIPGVGIDASPFTCADVDEVYFADDGENDGKDWVIAGRLKDGRFFGLRAYCDYTGWDCCAGGHARIARSYDEMIWFALEPDERERFGLARHREEVHQAVAHE